MTHKPIVTVFAVGTLLGLTTASAFGQLPPTGPIGFDPDGSSNENKSVDIGSFDWGLSSALSLTGVCPQTEPGCNNTIPITDLVNPTHLKVFSHGTLTGMKSPTGITLPEPIGLNAPDTGFEITFVAGACVVAKPIGTIDINGGTAAASVKLELDPNPACQADSNSSGYFFELWYDNFTDGIGLQSDPLSGNGFRDGKLILKGNVVTLTGTNAFTGNTLNELFDQAFGDNFNGTKTVIQQGSTSVNILVDHIDTDYFLSGIDHGSILPFTNEVRLPFRQIDPSKAFYSGVSAPAISTVTSIAPDVIANLGTINGVTGPHLEQQTDPSNSFIFIAPPLACRVTGGGNDTAGLPPAPQVGWDGTVAIDSVMSAPIAKGKGKSQVLSTVPFIYSFGGQAGANTALPPQPKGQWEHQNHDGPNGLQFNFKIGTSAAPKGTKIEAIACTDDDWCRQARPAPNKQIDFIGTGSFTSMENNTDAAVDNEHTFPGIKGVVPVPTGKRDKSAIPTYHWFQVHIEDLGEPGSQENASGANCPDGGSGNDPFANPPIIGNIADCNCADFYRIRIYAGFIPVLDENDNIVNTDEINKNDVIYEVWGYIDGGNFQIHPPTGFDLK